MLCGASTLLWMRDPVGYLTRYVSSASLAGVVALMVLQNAGGGYQIDMHMAYFAALAVLPRRFAASPPVNPSRRAAGA